MSLEEAHWRLSTMVAWTIGIRDRGWLREGMPADIVVYDVEKLRVRPMETVHDLPDGDWRRVQRPTGISVSSSMVRSPSRITLVPAHCPARCFEATIKCPVRTILRKSP